jgi:hypothetical protein
MKAWFAYDGLVTCKLLFSAVLLTRESWSICDHPVIENVNMTLTCICVHIDINVVNVHGTVTNVVVRNFMSTFERTKNATQLDHILKGYLIP